MAYLIQMRRNVADYPINYRVEHLQEAKTLFETLMDTLEYAEDVVHIIVESERKEEP